MVLSMYTMAAAGKVLIINWDKYSVNIVIQLLFFNCDIMKQACSLNTNKDENLKFEFHPTIKNQIIFG